jgi:nitroreductase
MSGDPLDQAELLTLFEAARWAPSTRNEQEWRFFYARRGTPHWDAFHGLLAEGNKTWCAKAAVLVIVVSRTRFSNSGGANPVHSYDCGAAWQNLALQAAAMGLVAHGMAGFDYAKAREVLRLPDDQAVEAMIALGRAGDPADLPDDLQAREKPSGRKPVAEIIHEGPLPG